MPGTHHRAPAPAGSTGWRAVTHRVPLSWAVVVPVKRLAQAKSRLVVRTETYRRRLALAMATDTVTAALACRRVRTLVVVTDDPVAAPVLADAGASILPDEPDSGLNPALRHGAARATATEPSAGIVALSADLPALHPGELTRALDAARPCHAMFVPDAVGTGTTLYATAPGVTFTPAFGAGSRDRHIASGAEELTMHGVGTLRTDVDTAEDLDRALELGAGPHTGAVVAAMRSR